MGPKVFTVANDGELVVAGELIGGAGGGNADIRPVCDLAAPTPNRTVGLPR